jgi:hypothetical protein
MKCFQSRWIFPLTLVVFGLTNASYANHIDFIDDAGFFLFASSNIGSSSDTQIGAAGNILGTEREVDLSFSAGNGFIATGIIAPPGPGPVVGPPSNPAIELLFDNSVNSLGTLTLTYDGLGGGGFAPPVDFDTLWNFITVDMSAVQGTGDLTVAVTDSLNNTGSLTGAVATAGTYSFPFSHPNYAGVDFSSVSRVVVSLTATTAASDFAINEITREASPGEHNIPEPSAMLLLGIGLLGVLGVRQRFGS